MKKHIMRQLNSRGDEKIAEWTLENEVEVQRALDEFVYHTAERGSVAFNGTTSERLETFDPQIEETIIVPQIAGG